VEEVIVKTQVEIIEKAHTNDLRSQNKATGNECMNLDIPTWCSMKFQDNTLGKLQTHKTTGYPS
jgi:hypothetical protein